LLTGLWDGSRAERVWDRAPAVRLHPVGRSYSVIRTWLEAEERFHGWYVNLEQPWVRTTVGFDSRDDVLDIIVTDDLRECTLKDEDELDFAVDEGKLTPGDTRSIRATSDSAIKDVTSRRWPFVESAWQALRPTGCDQPLDLPLGWDNP
jgi:predicted RNA-binding protein associated with RNAse of E/G family